MCEMCTCEIWMSVNCSPFFNIYTVDLLCLGFWRTYFEWVFVDDPDGLYIYGFRGGPLLYMGLKSVTKSVTFFLSEWCIYKNCLL